MRSRQLGGVQTPALFAEETADQCVELPLYFSRAIPVKLEQSNRKTGTRCASGRCPAARFLTKQ